ncbi:MAG: rhodanese-like domain-containing protein [Anaerolineaceae bacterium]
MKNKKSKSTSKKSFPMLAGLALVVVILAVTAVLVFQKPQSSQPSTVSLPAEISVDQAAKMRDEGAFILDVREPQEWAQFHIPGSTLIPLGELSNRLNEIPENKDIVVVCRSGNRSAQGRDILLDAGFNSVTSMAKGVTQWQVQGLPIATGE